MKGKHVKKEKIHNVNELKGSDGKPNHGKVMAAAAHFLKQKEAGHYTATETMNQTDLPNGDTQIDIRIVRHEVDKKEPADPAPALQASD